MNIEKYAHKMSALIEFFGADAGDCGLVCKRLIYERNEIMSKKKRKIQNKSVAMFAFALSLIASRSVATISASANTLDINQDEYRLTDERNAGTGVSAYTKISANTYLATGKSYSTYNFINSLKRVNGFSAVGKVDCFRFAEV